jgi:phytoene synthase
MALAASTDRFPPHAAQASLADAYRVCARIARTHYENFPVASILLPRAMRPHVAAVYAFAREADDFADEGRRSAAARHRLLDDWMARLRASAAGTITPGTWPAIQGVESDRESREAARRADAIFEALGHTIRACDLPVALFEDLLSAFRQDITTTRYATWAELMDYCRRSANPVGRIVLRIAGYDRPDLDRASDAFCSGLQLTNFWQDLERDWVRGRLYVPAEEIARAGADTAALDGRQLTAAWRQALGRASVRTRGLFDEARLLCDSVQGRLRLELRLTWLGGVTILDRLERAGFDVFRSRPALGAPDVPRLVLHALRWT